MQGLTGGQGRFHGLRNKAYGTKVVGGVTPGKGGQDVEGVPVYDSVADAVKATGATASFIAVPPKFASAAILEAAEAGVAFIVPLVASRRRRGLGLQPLASTSVRGWLELSGCHQPRPATSASRRARRPGTAAGRPAWASWSLSGTLTYQALYELKQKGIGVTTCVGIGGDPVPGTSFVDCLAAFQDDPDTKAMLMIGEIGGTGEEEAAAFIAANVTKPMSAYIAGVTAPAGKKMGHAGAIVSGGKGTAQGKMDALAAAGVEIGLNPTEAGELMEQILEKL